jgi:hypothetical protein
MHKFIVPRHTVAKFLRSNDGTPIGLACAVKDASGKVKVGWSFIAKPDRQPGRISKNLAWEIAVNRVDGGCSKRPPHSLIPVISEVQQRALKYFRVDVATVVGDLTSY